MAPESPALNKIRGGNLHTSIILYTLRLAQSFNRLRRIPGKKSLRSELFMSLRPTGVFFLGLGHGIFNGRSMARMRGNWTVVISRFGVSCSPPKRRITPGV